MYQMRMSEPGVSGIGFQPVRAWERHPPRQEPRRMTGWKPIPRPRPAILVQSAGEFNGPRHSPSECRLSLRERTLCRGATGDLGSWDAPSRGRSQCCEHDRDHRGARFLRARPQRSTMRRTARWRCCRQFPMALPKSGGRKKTQKTQKGRVSHLRFLSFLRPFLQSGFTPWIHAIVEETRPAFAGQTGT